MGAAVQAELSSWLESHQPRSKESCLKAVGWRGAGMKLECRAAYFHGWMGHEQARIKERRETARHTEL